MAIDTLEIAKALRAADFSPDKAEAVAGAIGRAIAGGVATKADLLELQNNLRTEIGDLRVELTQDIHAVELRLKTEMGQMEVRMMAALNGMTWRMIGFLVAVMGLAVAAIKLLPSAAGGL